MGVRRSSRPFCLAALFVMTVLQAGATPVGTWLYSLSASNPLTGGIVSALNSGNSDMPPSTNVAINSGTSHSEVSFGQNTLHQMTGFQGIAQIPSGPASFSAETSAASILDYSFTVVSTNGSPVSNVPIILSGFFDAESNGSAVASVTAQIEYAGAILADTSVQCITATGLSCMSSRSFTLTANVNSFTAAQVAADNTLASAFVALDGSADVYGDFLPGDTTESAAFSEDSLSQLYVSIDPTFLAANPGYVLEVSAGIANTAPTPEPCYVYSIAAALSGLALRMKRKR